MDRMVNLHNDYLDQEAGAEAVEAGDIERSPAKYAKAQLAFMHDLHVPQHEPRQHESGESSMEMVGEEEG